MSLVEAVINGRPYTGEIADNTLLLDFIRDGLGLFGTKQSCEVQVCGACTVLVDGLPVSACTTLAYEVRDRSVLTIEGLADAQGNLHPIQRAFLDEFAFQCGFCTPGMIMAATALLDQDPTVDETGIEEYMDGNLCRCTGYLPILHAIKRAQAAMEVGA
jgi:aerobic carbon-monoxide dehydrogenase small subunit